MKVLERKISNIFEQIEGNTSYSIVEIYAFREGHRVKNCN